jgi:NAD-dependent SIR2 family protein deacetylase
MYIQCENCLWEDYIAYLKPKEEEGEALKCPECGGEDIIDNTHVPKVTIEDLLFLEEEDE